MADHMADREPAARSESISPPPIKRRKLSGTDDRAQSCQLNDRLTIYSWNVNGIVPLLPAQKPITSFFKPQRPDRPAQISTAASTSLRDVLRRYQWPTVLFLQEVKINPDDHATQRAVEKAVLPGDEESPRGPAYRVFFCLPTDKHNARGFSRKVYGVCSIIRQDFHDDFVVRVREVSWDVEGRFLVCETKAIASAPRLAIFNVYAVNGTDFYYKSPKTGEIQGSRHDRKLEVHRLLQEECRSLESQGFCVIIAGDLNIARTPLDGHPNLRTFPRQHCLNRADFEARFFYGPAVKRGDAPLPKGSEGGRAALDLIDTFRHLNADRPGYTYYPRGRPFGSSCDRVDMILASRSLQNQLVEAGIHATPLDRGTSDHVPLFASFDLRKAINQDV